MKRLILIVFSLAFVTVQPFAQTQTQPAQRSINRSAPIRSREPASLDLIHALLKARVVRFLLDHGAKVDAMGDSGRALVNAARGNAEIAAMIRAAMPN